MENCRIVQDKIFSRSNGYLAGYSVVSKSKRQADGLWRVTIRASVKSVALKDDLAAIGNLLARVGNPRFTPAHLPETKSSLPSDARATLAAAQAISGIFARKGFTVLDHAVQAQVCAAIRQTEIGNAVFAHLAAQKQKGSAELLLLYDIRRSESRDANNATRLTVEISLRAVAAATADLIAEKKSALQLNISQTGGSAGYAGPQAAARLAEGEAEALVSDPLTYFQRGRGRLRLNIRFQDFSSTSTFRAIDSSSNAGYTRAWNKRSFF